ncbi:MAG TPA: ABC transporter substrate-binding protein [Gemmatimonadales bacterium]|jgi:iron complex transport system substrate-binding protein|nr:ABC transporter substrate-binding protein [Gemmatimonadales bacterium]
MPRIVSLLPAGTEIVHALGAGQELVGRSHECDYPAGVTRLPVVSRPALRLESMAPEEIDRAVAERLKRGESLYEVDELLLDELRPELILTQNLCQVCAPSGNELSRALRDLTSTPEVIWLSPQSLADIERNILAVGDAIGRRAEAEALVAGNQERIMRVGEAVAGAEVRRVVFLEWIEPLFSAGHWVPEMIALAGGLDPLGRAGADSVRVSREDVLTAEPDMVIVAPCGYGLERAVELGSGLGKVPGAKVYAVDANAYFARPGPRVAEGIELLAHLFHPERFRWPNDGRPWRELGAR